MVQLYVDALNSPGGIPVIGSTWQRVLEATYTHGLESAVKIYKEVMEKAAKSLPIESEQLMGHHRKGVEEMMEKFKEAASLDSERAVYEAYLDKLMVIEKCYRGFIQKFLFCMGIIAASVTMTFIPPWYDFLDVLICMNNTEGLATSYTTTCLLFILPHVCFFQDEIAVYNEDGECSGGLLALYLEKNYGASNSACQTLVNRLKQKHLDPLIKNLTPETDFKKIEDAFVTLISQYNKSCIGPASDAVLNTFVQVSEINYDWGIMERQHINSYQVM